MITADAPAGGGSQEHTPPAEASEWLEPLPAAARRVWQTSNVLGTLATAAVVVGAFRTPLPPDGWRAWEVPVLGLLGLFALLEAVIFIPLRHRCYRYGVLESAIVVVRGRLIRRQSVYPLRHVLHVDTRQGPVLRRWGLVEVRLGTIAGGHPLGPVPGPVAEACRRAVESAEGTRNDGADDGAGDRADDLPGAHAHDDDGTAFGGYAVAGDGAGARDADGSQ